MICESSVWSCVDLWWQWSDCMMKLPLYTAVNTQQEIGWVWWITLKHKTHQHLWHCWCNFCFPQSYFALRHRLQHLWLILISDLLILTWTNCEFLSKNKNKPQNPSSNNCFNWTLRGLKLKNIWNIYEIYAKKYLFTYPPELQQATGPLMSVKRNPKKESSQSAINSEQKEFKCFLLKKYSNRS